MPIQFPLPLRGNPFDRWQWQRGAKCPQQQRAPNLAKVGFDFMDDHLGAGLPMPKYRPHVRGNYTDPQRTAMVGPASELQKPGMIGPNNPRIYLRVLGNLRMILSGVTRDSAGSPLGSVTVMVFRTDDKAFVTQTVSDASTGAWSVDLLAGGPFFTVDYLVGVPDRAGTSVNTLVPSIG